MDDPFNNFLGRLESRRKAARGMTPEQRKKNREAQRKWWRNLTPEQREKQRERRREWRRSKRKTTS